LSAARSITGYGINNSFFINGTSKNPLRTAPEYYIMWNCPK
jgi:hypothetical protein